MRSVVDRNNFDCEDECERQCKAAHDRRYGISGYGEENIEQTHRSHERDIPDNQPLKHSLGDRSPLQTGDLLDRFPDTEKQKSKVIKPIQTIKIVGRVENNVIPAADRATDGFRNEDKID